MKSRSSSALLVILLSVALPTFAQKNHVDISLRGPWILYVDSSKSFADWPVLIAMAPGVDPSSMWAHQIPTISNGVAYVLGDLNQIYPPSDSQIYCLTFDSKCARQGASSLDSDDYPKPSPVLAHIPKGQKHWDWVTASRQYYSPTLVLPVPDSYSADTAWPMRFGPAFDAQGKGYKYDSSYSTGVVLHYTSGPTSFDLNSCPNGKPTPNPNIGNCTKPVSIKHTHLTNTGTLHIDMKAPDTDWSCDPHVRRVYPAMLKLIGGSAGPAADWAVIDPAHDLDDNGSGVYDSYLSGYASPQPDPNNSIKSEYCLEHDSQGQYNDTRWVAPSGDDTKKEHTEARCNGAAESINPWIGCVQQIVKAIPAELDLSTEEGRLLNEIRSNGSDLSFPRLSQLRRLDDNMAFLGQLKTELDAKKLPADRILPTWLKTIFDILPKILPTDPYTKTHGDCGAPVMYLTDK